jgi:hypothetical protein
MADGFVQVAPDSTGKKIDTTELAVNGLTVQRSRFTIYGSGASSFAEIGRSSSLQVGGSNDAGGAISSSEYPHLIAGSDYGGTPAKQTLKIDSSGNAFVSATLSAETTKVIGTVRNLGNAGGIFDFAGQNATQPANSILIGGEFNTSPTALTDGHASPLQLTAAANLKIDLSTVAGTAPTTAGKLDIKGADGDVFVRQATAANLNATVVGTGTFAVQASQAGNWTARIVGNAGASLDATVGAGSAPTNILITGAQFNSTAPVPTTGQTMALQADQAGNLRVFNGVASGTLVTISAANTNDTLNATQNIFTNSGGDAAIVQLTPTGTLTTGAITFEVSFDGSSWQTVPAAAVMDPTSSTFAQIAVPFTPVSGTNKFFLITNNGWQGLRIKVSTAFTGTGHSVAINYTLVSFDPVDNVIALSPSAANFNAAVKRAPDATSTFAPTSVDSTALEASHILKAAAGVLYGFTGYSARTTSQFIQVHNSATLPADTAVPVIVFFVPAGPVSFSWDAPAQFGKFFSAGITTCNSTTGPTKTIGSADCWFNASLA